jgi:hypothetical protein
VIGDPIPNLPGEVQILKDLNYPDRLEIVFETGQELGDDLFPHMAERGVAKVVAKADRLDQILVELEGASDGSRYLRDLESVGQADPVMVALGGQEDLGLVSEPTERLAMDYPVPVPTEGCSDGVLRLRAFSAHRVGGQPRPMRQGQALALLCLQAK